MLPQKPGTESAREKACSPWNTNYPATWSHRLRQFKETGPLWAERRTPLPPSRDTGNTRQGPHAACSIKKRAPASLEPVCFFMVGMARFERAASASRTLRSSQTEPHPVARENITPKACRMQAFFQKNFSPLMSGGIRSCPAESRTWRYMFCAYRAIRL
mgnify:CR=1 FL=1